MSERPPAIAAFAALVGFILGFGVAAETSGRIDDDRINAGGFQRNGHLYRIEQIAPPGDPSQ